MKKMAVIYWSQTGNTKIMAEAIGEGAKEAGADVTVVDVCDTTVDQALTYDLLALGCPSMGDEVLEEVDFEPFFTDLEKRLGGKKVALFGSYGWGDGQWMRDWQARTDGCGAVLFKGEGLIINETPNEQGVAECKAFGSEFAAS